MNVVALILAGGLGSRMGRPKQFIELLGHPALRHTLRAFEEAPGIERIYTVGDRERVEDLVATAGISKHESCALPGESRSLSAKNGLDLCDREGPDTIVLIHDGSRCLVTPELIQRVAEAALEGESDGVIPTLPVSDTIKVCEENDVIETLERGRLRATQTPQAFRLGLIRRVHGSSGELHTAPDDASLVEHAGGRITTVPGDKTNIKLTSPEDLILAEAILIARNGIHPRLRWGVRL